MADHVQQQILEAVQTVLVAASTAAASRVYLDRVDEIPQSNLPAIDILGPQDTGEEAIEYLTMHFPAVQQRAYSFAINSVCALADGAAKAARNLDKQIEAALLAAIGTITVGGKAIDLVVGESTERKDASASLSMFAVRRVWQAQYQTTAGTPDVPR